MPNWCSNDITLRHSDPAMIERAHQALIKQEFLNEFVPMPKALDITAGSLGTGTPEQAELELKEQDNLNQFGFKNWYDWCVANWGTKWDVGDADAVAKVDDNTLEASFDSAWAPPVAAFEKLADLGFEIVAYYHEPGAAFCGKWTANDNGIEDDCREYEDETSETVRDFVGEELDDYFCISEDMARWEEEDDDEDSDEDDQG